MKKLIEVALPLDVINRHGYPSTLHLWWSRKPTATARAVLFASLIDDPSERAEKFPTAEAQQAERERLFKLIEKLVQWESSGNEEIFADALNELKKSVGEDLPAVFDPFAGGGTIPLEAQRLGLKAFASDLNPVAVMINKAMIELPAQFKNRPPVNPADKNFIDDKNNWRGAQGLAADIFYYGKLLKARAFEKIGKLYPKADGKTVIAWLWARTVTCSNPACNHRLPLVHSFKLSTKQKVFVEPIVDGDKIRFEIREGDDAPEGTVNRNGARCLFCGSTVPLAHVRNEGKAGRLGAQLMAIVAEGLNGRIYLAPDEAQEKIAAVEEPEDFPNGDLPDKALGFRVQEYGITEWHQLFTNRQLTALMTFSDLISEVKKQIINDGGEKIYADALAVYLAFLIDRIAEYNSIGCSWNVSADGLRGTFGRQAVPIVWSFAEANFFSDSVGSLSNMLEAMKLSLQNLPVKKIGEVFRHSALEKFSLPPVMVSSDPPYYDNIGYANLSEFFYVWMRRPLKNIYPQLFGRMTFEKTSELIAEPARFENDKTAAKNFFEDGMFQALKNIFEVAHENFPVTIYYAFKQQEKKLGGTASTGWETMLTSLIRAGKNAAGDNRAGGYGSSGNRVGHQRLFALRKNHGHGVRRADCPQCFENHQRGACRIFRDAWTRRANFAWTSSRRAGAVISSRGRVRLRDRDEMPVLIEKKLNEAWVKILVEANCAWLWVQSLVLVFKKIGIARAAELISKFDGDNESLKNLAYRLYDICEKKIGRRKQRATMIWSSIGKRFWKRA